MPVLTDRLKWSVNGEKVHYPLWIMGFFFLLTLHFYQTNVGGTGLSLPFNALSWIPVSFIIGLGLYRIAASGVFYYSWLTLVLALCCLLLAIPAFFPGSVAITGNPVFFGLAAGLAFFVSLQQFRLKAGHLQLLLILLLLSVWVESLIGWLQYFGFDWTTPGIEKIGTRPQGNFRQVNVLASYLATGLVVSAYLPAQHHRSGDEKTGRYLRILFLLSPVVLIPMLVVTGSRTGWVGSVVGVLLILPYLWKGNPSTARAWCLMVVAGLCVGGLLVFMTETEGFVLARAGFETNRTSYYPQVFQMGLEKPLSGYGYGRFENAYNLFAAEKFAAGEFDSPGMPNLSHPHNELLFWWTGGGIIALLALLIAATAVIAGIFKCGDRMHVPALLALFFPITFHTQTELPFYCAISHWIVFILLIFLVDFHAKRSKAATMPFVLLPKVGAFLVPMGVSWFMLTTLQTGNMLTRFERDWTTDISTLSKVSNPVVWQDRMSWDINFSLLILGIREHRPELIRPYIDWAPSLIKRKPRGLYYQYLVIAYEALGDENMAKQIRKEAEFRLPRFNFDFTVPRGNDLESRKFPEALTTKIIPDD